MIDLSNVYTYVPKERYWSAVENLYPHLSADGYFKLHYGDSDMVKEFTFLDKTSYSISVQNIDKSSFIV